MAFKSDRQRKGFFGSRGNVRSNINPKTRKKKKRKSLLESIY